MVNPFGSMFDDWEVPPEARISIFNMLAQLPPTSIVFETRADTVSYHKIAECARILGHHYVGIELGVETSDPWISQYCVNKSLLPQDIQAAVTVIVTEGLHPIANILVGTPFLTYFEMVNDAISSINWAFSTGFERCVVFPISIKPSTLVAWLEERGLYTQPPLWALVDVLSGVEPKMLPNIEIVWFRPPNLKYPDAQIPSRVPRTCPNCYDTVIGLLDTFRCGRDRRGVLEKLTELHCECRETWQCQVKTKPVIPLGERVQAIYQAIGRNLLGDSWWLENGKDVLANLPRYDGI
jgi:radical SAM enzyme (TIGR01210 family)